MYASVCVCVPCACAAIPTGDMFSTHKRDALEARAENGETRRGDERQFAAELHTSHEGNQTQTDTAYTGERT
eukprot:56591-Eustigmatos_ZCMA.PRE.1